jgi:two-component system alkaline phosphatase synthesis response regulator PhoP
MPEKILIIDDEEDLRLLLRERLQVCGYEVVEAADGLAGMEVATNEKPDLIIFDLMMPVMTGEQFWAELRRDPVLKQVPTIVLTAKRQYQDRYWGRSMPAQDFFSKPFKFDDLLKRIRQKLSKKSDAPAT